MQINFKALLIVVLLPLLCAMPTACGADEPSPTPTPEPARRTILVYMVANNSLGAGGRDEQDLQEMEQAVGAGALAGCRLLVYRIGYNDTQATLVELARGTDGAAHRTVLETYPAVEAASVTGGRLAEAIADARRHAPAGDYGLVLWSHATGWAPSLTTRPAGQQRVFGLDAGHSMPVDELARAIPQGVFSWIYADACYMGGIEVAYELRRCCRRLVAYPTEIPATGMPYHLTLPLLCAPEADLAGACRATYNFYNAMSGSQRTFSGVVVDCTQLDALADVCRRIHAAPDAATPSVGSMQCYNLGESHFLYDFAQYTTACTASEQLRGEFAAALGRVVLDRMATPAIFNRFLIFDSAFSGLSTYAAGTSPGVNDDYYRSLQWHADVMP